MGRIQRKKDPQKKKAKKKSKDAEALKVKSNGTAAVQKKQVAPPKKPYTVTKAPTIKADKNVIEKSLQFLREVKVELKKVTWPSRKQTMGSTLVVIILVMIISLFLGLVDMGLSSLIRSVLQ